MTATRYEIRNADTNWKLMSGNARDVRKFFEKEKPEEKRTAKEDGVIVIYVTFPKVAA